MTAPLLSGGGGWKQDSPGMNLGPQPSPIPVLVHLRVGLHPLTVLAAESEAEAAAWDTVLLPLLGMVKPGHQRAHL